MMPASTRLLAAAAVIAAYIGFCIIVFLRHRRKSASARRASASLASGEGNRTLIAYASQTGLAEQIAARTAETLTASGVPVSLLPMGQVDTAALQNVRNALFIASTTGEGDAPDHATAFVRTMAGTARLGQLEYGLLALGDRSYRHFCGFGMQIDHWLHRNGAHALFDMVMVDNGDQGALRHWQQNLRLFGANADAPDWQAPHYHRWTMVERRLLNPGSEGWPAFAIALAPQDDMPNWQAGDIAEIGPCNDPAAVDALLSAHGLGADHPVHHDGKEVRLGELLSRSILPLFSADTHDMMTADTLAAMLKPLPHREYSIASLPCEGRLMLIVRQMRDPQGGLGLGSGWLTQYADTGTAIDVRIRTNRSFHAADDDRPMIFIGNGTGIAGLRAHLKTRALAGHGRNWLVFGERNRDRDYFLEEEMEAWRAAGLVERIDLAFSRDTADHPYVQHRLRQAPDTLVQWVNDGADILVCGSLNGMAGGVHQALTDILGEARVDRMMEQGRYRRDVY